MPKLDQKHSTLGVPALRVGTNVIKPGRILRALIAIGLIIKGALEPDYVLIGAGLLVLDPKLFKEFTGRS